MNIIKIFIDKCLSVAYMGENWNNKLIQGIIEAGRTISYVETTTPTQSDTLHLAIKESDNKTFMHEFEQGVKFALVKLKSKRVKIAFDTTEDLCWCRNNLFNLRPSVYEHPLLSWQYLSVSIIEPYFIPLMSIPYRQIDNLDMLDAFLHYFYVLIIYVFYEYRNMTYIFNKKNL